MFVRLILPGITQVIFCNFQIRSNECQAQQCNSCASLFKEVHDSTVYECPDCLNIFCCDCDLFFHEVLHSCSGCISMNEKNPKINSEKLRDNENLKANQNGNHAAKKVITTNGVSQRRIFPKDLQSLHNRLCIFYTGISVKVFSLGTD